MGGLITALVIASIAVLATAFWDEIHQWIKGIIERIGKTLVEGFKIFIKKVGEAFIEIVKIWKKNGNTGKWTVTTETREVSENEVPEDIRNNARKREEVEITEEYKEKVELMIS